MKRLLSLIPNPRIFLSGKIISYGHRLKSLKLKSSIKQELLMLAGPIFIETLLIMTLGAVDTFMLSRYSDEAVASVGMVNQIITFCFLIFEVINLGTSVLCSQYLGAKMNQKMENVVVVSLVVNLLVGILISVVLYCFATPILNAMGLDNEMLNQGVGYMRIVGAFAFVQAIAMTLSATLRANNKAYYPMAVIAIVNVLNIIGNYALIFGKFGAPALGVEGAAISTMFARSVAMVMLFIILFKTTIKHFPKQVFQRFPFEELRNLLKIGLPSAGEQMSYSSSQLVITFFINMLGMEALAARTYCVNIIMFGYLFCISIAQGGAICIGHLVGAGKSTGAFVLGKYVMKNSILITFSLSLLLALNGNWIVRLLTDNVEIVEMCTTILWIDVLLELGRPTNIFAVNALRAVGDVNYPFYVGVSFMWTIAVLAAYWFGIVAGFGIFGMWWMFTLDENVRGVVFIHRWYSMKWKNKAFVNYQGV